MSALRAKTARASPSAHVPKSTRNMSRHARSNGAQPSRPPAGKRQHWKSPPRPKCLIAKITVPTGPHRPNAL
eukprot:11224144-Lingulodinium_polyedra.AAC.1